MATCSICNDGKRLTAHGLKIHMGKVHDIHYEGAVEPNTQIPLPQPIALAPHGPALVQCPCLFCNVRLPAKDMREHWDRDHPTWKLHTGLFTWEV
jgi:hypothetical protein